MEEKRYTVAVECPFYMRNTLHEIVCEGAEPNTVITVRYKYRKQREEYMENFCADRCFQGCRYYQAANEKYEDEKR